MNDQRLDIRMISYSGDILYKSVYAHRTDKVSIRNVLGLVNNLSNDSIEDPT